MNYHIITVTNFLQNCLVIWDEKYIEQAALIDPGGDADILTTFLDNNGLIPSQILLTHGHIDHVGAAVQLATYYKVPILGPHYFDNFLLGNLSTQSNMLMIPECLPFIPDKWLEEDMSINVGNIILKVLHCPGHTPGHIVFFDFVNRFLISGDVIFRGSIGRTDFPKSNYNDLIQSIKNKLIPLGDDVIFLPGHGPKSTLGFERINNPFLQTKNK